MSTVNYSLKHKGVRLISAKDAWVRGKNGNLRLNDKYWFVGKIDIKLPNLVVTTSKNRKPSYKGCVSELNNVAKWQSVDVEFIKDKVLNHSKPMQGNRMKLDKFRKG